MERPVIGDPGNFTGSALPSQFLQNLRFTQNLPFLQFQFYQVEDVTSQLSVDFLGEDLDWFTLVRESGYLQPAVDSDDEVLS